MNLENIDKKQLFREITDLMQPLYFPVPYDEENIRILCQHEYELSCKVISVRYGFDIDKYVFEHDGHSPFDVIYEDVICELESRMRRDPFMLQRIDSAASCHVGTPGCCQSRRMSWNFLQECRGSSRGI